MVTSDVCYFQWRVTGNKHILHYYLMRYPQYSQLSIVCFMITMKQKLNLKILALWLESTHSTVEICMYHKQPALSFTLCISRDITVCTTWGYLRGSPEPGLYEHMKTESIQAGRHDADCNLLTGFFAVSSPADQHLIKICFVRAIPYRSIVADTSTCQGYIILWLVSYDGEKSCCYRRSNMLSRDTNILSVPSLRVSSPQAKKHVNIYYCNGKYIKLLT
jgi:hypothetical protein